MTIAYMLHFFELRTTVEPKIVGVRTGIGQAYTSDKFVADNPWYEAIFNGKPPTDKEWWRKWMRMPDHGGPLTNLSLRKAAKLTDIVDANLLIGYVVSDKVRTLLEKFTLPRHRYFEASFRRDDELVTGYWWLLYDLEEGAKTVDFAQSEFDRRWHEQHDAEPFSLNTYEDYLALIYQTGRALPATKLVFQQGFNAELDLWGAQFLSLVKGYVSPKLAAALKEANISGYELREPRCQLLFT
jgi:hypothetical protein